MTRLQVTFEMGDVIRAELSCLPQGDAAHVGVREHAVVDVTKL
ncbi:hypothetical protein [Bordetella sp. 15P40C-2]|nr:hypothetical protein [Bordetella sp. 15P40C-2]